MKKFLAILMVTLLFGMVPQANATLILDFGDSSYLGHIDDGIPASENSEVAYINNLKTLAAGAGPTTIGTETYDRIDSTLAGPFSTAVTDGWDRDDTGNNVFDATGFEYILGKYDGPNDGSYVWYMSGGFTEPIQLPAVHSIVGDGSYGLSHISGFNPVPEPTTMLLLGAGLAGLAGFGRKRFKK